MEISPEDTIFSFLEQARKKNMAVIVFSAFARDGMLIQRTNHNLNLGTEKAFMEQFLAVDAGTIEAAARAVLKFSVPEAKWEELSADQRTFFTKTAETILIAARTAQATSPLMKQKVLQDKPDPS